MFENIYYNLKCEQCDFKFEHFLKNSGSVRLSCAEKNGDYKYFLEISTFNQTIQYKINFCPRCGHEAGEVFKIKKGDMNEQNTSNK